MFTAEQALTILYDMYTPLARLEAGPTTDASGWEEP